jgi:hypothetical protein
MLKVVLSHLRGLPGAQKSAQKALCSSGIKIENHEDSVSTTFFQDVTFLDQVRFQQSRAKRANRCEPATLINNCSGNFLSFLSPPLKSKIIKICIVGRPCSYIGFAIYQLSPKSVEKCQKSIMQKRHKRLAKQLFFIPVTHF